MLRKFASRPDWQIAAIFTIVLRVFFSVMAAALSQFLHPHPAAIRSNALTDSLPSPNGWHLALFGIWERFDTLWYLHIAQHGYDQPMAAIFYPLYPALIRLFSGAMPSVAAALTASTIGTFFAFWGLLRMSSSPTTQGNTTPGQSIPWGIATLLSLAAWPSSFVLFAAYAESLTLALIVWAVLFAREDRWELATLCGILAGLCRPSGVLVAVPLILLAWRSRRTRSLVTILSPIGLLAYWGWLRYTGRLSVVDAYRIYQGATFAPPWASLSEIARLIFGHDDTVLALRLGLVVLALAFSLRREIQPEDKLFALALATQMLMYTGRPLLGGPRYVLPMYPAFLAMGFYATERWSPKKFAFYLATFGVLNLAWMWGFLKWSLVF
jgi:hypothetical protein